MHSERFLNTLSKQLTIKCSSLGRIENYVQPRHTTSKLLFNRTLSRSHLAICYQCEPRRGRRQESDRASPYHSHSPSHYNVQKNILKKLQFLIEKTPPNTRTHMVGGPPKQWSGTCRSFSMFCFTSSVAPTPNMGAGKEDTT